MLFTLFVFTVLICCSFFGYCFDQVESDFKLMAKHIPRDDFVCSAKSDPNHIHEVIIAIQQRNLPELKQMILDRATPGHPLYQQWLSFDDVGMHVQNIVAYKKVEYWLQDFNINITWVSTYYEYLKADAPISVWEKLLKAEFHHCEDHSRPSSSSALPLVFHRAPEYSIPIELTNTIQAVFNTAQVPPRYQHTHQPIFIRSEDVLKTLQLQPTGQPLGDYQNITISFLNSLYGITTNSGSAAFQQSIFETNGEYFSQNDLRAFQSFYNLPLQPATSIGDHETDSCTTTSCGEGNLDVQYINGLAQNTGTLFWWNGVDQGDSYVNWITSLAEMDNPPQSNSVSWTSFEQTVSPEVLTAWETEAMKVTGRGVTIVAASGDDGAPNRYNGDCLCSGAVS
jgi:subtilase family serine protease